MFHRDKVDRFYNDFGPAFGTNFTRSGSSVSGFSPRLRITAPVFGLKNQLVLGYDQSRWAYRNQQAFVFGGAASEGDLGNGNFSGDETGHQHNSAWYFKDDLRIGQVRLSAGARREALQQDTQNPLAFLPLTAVTRKLHAEEFGAAWNFLPAWTVYGRAGNSYRIGNIDENRFRFPAPGFLLPQTSQDKEAGLTYASRPVDAELRLFQSRLLNEILFVPATVAPPFGQNINLAPTERSGVELNVKWRPRSNLDLALFYTQMRALSQRLLRWRRPDRQGSARGAAPARLAAGQLAHHRGRRGQPRLAIRRQPGLRQRPGQYLRPAHSRLFDHRCQVHAGASATST